MPHYCTRKVLQLHCLLVEICLLISGEGDAACGLGGVYQQMGEYEKALQYHQLDLQLAEMTSNPVCQCKYLQCLIQFLSLVILIVSREK